DVPLHRAAQIHGFTVVFLLAIVVTLLVLLRRTGAPAGLRRRGNVLLAVLLGQALIGYVQYFTGVPVLLVGAHIAGAAAVWSAVVRFQLGLGPRARGSGTALARQGRDPALARA
ncbi:MAG: heme A synthase, partial [Acidimicrobiales bacterium]